MLPGDGDGGGDGHDDDEALFRDAMRGVVPLADRDRPAVGRVARPAPRVSEPPRFERDEDGARAAGVTHRQLADLRAGRVQVEATIDLHGLRAEEAVRTLRDRVLFAVEAGIRCLLVVHGRGAHSGGPPVLADAVVEALTQGPAAHLVRAFCPARAGAMYVLVARRGR
jgi:DNA-nicking Smr family endonuclease